MTLPASRNTTYAPGTQIKSVDLNDLQDLAISYDLDLRELFLENFITDMLRTGGGGTVARPLGGAAFPKPTGGLNVGVEPGLIFFATGGTPAYVWTHPTAATTLAINTGVGIGAGNVRHDIISTRAVPGTAHKYTIEYVYTAGTPAVPGVVVEPAVPGGYERLARVEMANGQTVVTLDDIVDWRTPLGARRYRVPMTLGVSTAGQWAINNLFDWEATVGTDKMAVPIAIPALYQRNLGSNARVAGLRLKNFTFTGRVKTSGGTPGYLHLAGKSNLFGGGFTTLVSGLESQVTDDVGGRYSVTPATTGNGSLPVWDNGARTSLPLTDDGFLELEIGAGSAADQMQALVVEWYGF